MPVTPGIAGPRHCLRGRHPNREVSTLHAAKTTRDPTEGVRWADGVRQLTSECRDITTGLSAT